MIAYNVEIMVTDFCYRIFTVYIYLFIYLFMSLDYGRIVLLVVYQIGIWEIFGGKNRTSI